MARVAGAGLEEPSGFQRHGRPTEAARAPCIMDGSPGKVALASVDADPVPLPPVLWLNL